MKIKLNTIYTLIISLIIVINEKYIFMTKNFGSWLTVLLIFTIGLTIWNILKKNNEKFYFKNFILLYLIMNMITMLITIFKYGQPIGLAISKYKFVFIILLYFPLIKIIKKIGTDKVYKIIIILAIFSASIMIIQKFTYGYLTIIHNGITLRNGKFRNFQIQNIVSIAIILLTNYLFYPHLDYKYKSKTKVLIFLIPLIYYTVNISDTRSSGITLLGTILIIIWLNTKQRINKKELKIFWNIISIFISGILIFIGYRYINEVIGRSIAINESSSINRIGAINYYINKFIEEPLFGYGLYSTSYEYGLILTGANLHYYADDIGVFGYIFQYGTFGIILGIYFVTLINKIIKRLDKYSKNKYLGIYIYFIIILPFNILLNLDTGMLYLCLFMGCIEVCYEENRCIGG